jgi:hypothetical protein
MKRNIDALAQIAEILHELAATEKEFQKVVKKVEQVSKELDKPVQQSNP